MSIRTRRRELCAFSSMAANSQSEHSTSTLPTARAMRVDERAVWGSYGAKWHQLYGNFHELGVSFEWHDLRPVARVDWAQSFHPRSLELCFNLAGEGQVDDGSVSTRFGDQSVGFYFTGAVPLRAWREKGQHHQFLSVEFSPRFVERHLGSLLPGLHPMVGLLMKPDQVASVAGPSHRLTSGQLEIVQSLRQPPVFALAQPAWYLGKAMELAAVFLYQPPPEKELFCHRQQHVAAQRVERVLALLREHLAEPPTLADLSQKAGCSPFYLSRTFSRETGMTISQYLRRLRMEKAAELLRSGRFNVTEAALEVGYSSLSHFSHTFHQTFGCCPGLYPVGLIKR